MAWLLFVTIVIVIYAQYAMSPYVWKMWVTLPIAIFMLYLSGKSTQKCPAKSRTLLSTQAWLIHLCRHQGNQRFKSMQSECIRITNQNKNDFLGFCAEISCEKGPKDEMRAEGWTNKTWEAAVEGGNMSVQESHGCSTDLV